MNSQMIGLRGKGAGEYHWVCKSETAVWGKERGKGPGVYISARKVVLYVSCVRHGKVRQSDVEDKQASPTHATGRLGLHGILASMANHLAVDDREPAIVFLLHLSPSCCYLFEVFLRCMSPL